MQAGSVMPGNDDWIEQDKSSESDLRHLLTRTYSDLLWDLWNGTSWPGVSQRREEWYENPEQQAIIQQWTEKGQAISHASQKQ